MDEELILRCYDRASHLHDTNVLYHTLQVYQMLRERKIPQMIELDVLKKYIHSIDPSNRTKIMIDIARMEEYLDRNTIVQEEDKAEDKNKEKTETNIKNTITKNKADSFKKYLEENSNEPTTPTTHVVVNREENKGDMKHETEKKAKKEKKKKNSNKKGNAKVIPCRYEHSGFCRSKNIRYHRRQCSFKHIYPVLPTKVTSYEKIELTPGHVEYDNIAMNFYKTMRHDPTEQKAAYPDVSIVTISRIANVYLKMKFEERKQYLLNRSKNTDERKLYHGTYASMHHHIFKKGFIVPPDYESNSRCPRSGKFGISICGSSCQYCIKPHEYHAGCHMYGLGVYFSDSASKTHSFVAEPTISTKNNIATFKMILCSVLLGKSYLIEWDLRHESELHNKILAPHHHDSIMVKGRKDARDGLGVKQSEFVIFHPYQALPTHEIVYQLPITT